MEQLLTIDAVAGLLSTSRRHVVKLQQEHKLPSVRVGGLVRFRPQDVENYINGTAAGGVK